MKYGPSTHELSKTATHLTGLSMIRQLLPTRRKIINTAGNITDDLVADCQDFAMNRIEKDDQ